MTIVDRLRYDGKRALVVGGATGMGAAAAKSAGELGAEVIVMDYAPVKYDVAKSIQVDLRDTASIDAALEQLDGPGHAVFSAAGISTVVFGPGGAGAHATEEWVDLTSVATCADVLETVARDFCG